MEGYIMRTLYEIVEDVRDNKKPDYEEIRYALLVYNLLCSIWTIEIYLRMNY